MIWFTGVMFLHPAYGAASPIIGCKVIIWICVNFDGVIAFIEPFRLEITGLGIHKAVELVKTALQWP